MLNKLYFTILFFCVVSLCSLTGNAQVTIAGPACAVSGSTGGYTPSRTTGTFSGVTMTWSVTGGTIVQAYGGITGGTSTSKTGTNIFQIVVQWNNVVTGTVMLTTGVGNAPNKTVTVTSPVNPGTIPNTSQSIVYNQAPGAINCSVASFGYCTPSYQYQWQKSIDNSSWSDISGAKDQNLSFSAGIIQTTYYRRRVYETNTSTFANSNTATVFVTAPFTQPVIGPATQDIFTDQTPAALTFTTAPTGGNCTGFSYFWQTSTDGTNFTDNGTNNVVSFTPPVTLGTTYYRVRIVCGSDPAFSNAVTVNVYQHLATPQFSPSTLYTMYGTAPVLSPGSATGGTCGGIYTYKWKQSSDNVNFVDITSWTLPNYNPPPTTTTIYYKRIVSCGAETVSATVTVNINPEITAGSIAPGNLVITPGTSPGTLSCTGASGGNCIGNYVYEWQSGTDGTNFPNTALSNAQQYTPAALTVNTYYRVKITCGSDITYTYPVLITIKTGGYSYNFIQERTITKPLVTTAIAADAITALQDAKQATQYFDGLGRPIQFVIKQGSLPTDPSNPSSSATAVDMVSQVVYDQFGQEQFKYLSFASTATGTSKNDGNIKPDAFSQEAAFYNNAYAASPVKGQGETWLFSQSGYERSPLRRVMKSTAPGNSWTGAARGITASYWTNTAADAVRIWTVSIGATGSFSSYASTATYAAGKLYKNVTADENGNQVIEFTDMEGKTILKKVQLTAVADNSSGSDHTGWLCTYYLYDDLKNLRCVIQPAGVELISSAWTLTDATILAEQCFRYEYDERNRMIIKKVPGANEVYMVYDQRDRMVMTQDANQRALNKWMVILYDAMNRAKGTGLLLNTWNGNSFAQHRAAASVSSGYPFTVEPSATYWEILTATFYDNYGWLATNGNPFPQNRDNGADWLFYAASNATYPYPQAMTQSFAMTGMVTGSFAKVIGTASQYLYTINYYDEKGRVLQTHRQNIMGSLDLSYNQYNYAGQVIANYSQTTDQNGLGGIAGELTRSDYDDLGRLITNRKSIYSAMGNIAERVLAQYEYDALGQLKTKKLAPGYNSGAGLQTLAYDYNIRGWMLGMNRANLSANDAGSTFFGFELGYDKTTNTSGRAFTAAQYNGNINGMIWKSNGDGIRRKYDFSYDASNKLMQGLFEQNDQGSTWGTSLVNYTVKMGDGITATSAYDANGNIKQMQQWGLKAGSSSQVDNLTYTQVTNSNKLQAVTDAFNDNTSTLGDFKYDPATKTATDYSYDANGNLTLDNNKKISSIAYNHLNLPSVITMPKGTITYTYDAGGVKLSKVVQENNATVPYAGRSYTTNITTSTYYAAVLGATFEKKIYSNPSLSALNPTIDQLMVMSHEEGRIRFNNQFNGFNYDYFLKDHLGNTRMVLTEELQTDMYPAATMETGMQATEQTYYSNLPATRIAAPSGYPANTPPGNVNVAKVNGGGNKIGPAMVLKVMSGDKFNLAVNSWWSSGNTSFTNVSPLTDIAAALATGMAGVSGGKATATELTGSGLPTSNASSFLGTQSVVGTKPKAYINWILLDEQFKIIKDATGNIVGSGSEQVGSAGVYTTHTRTNMPVTKNGYLYIYVSNESSNQDVFFDNLQVTHIRGPLTEETHYYPFGLTMAGISSQALRSNYVNNKIKFQRQELQSKEFSDGSGLETYEFKYRMDDPQIGRFWSIDPLANKYVYNSTYAFSENKVTRHVELEGLESVDSNDPRVRAIMSSGAQKQMSNFNKNASESAEAKVTIGAGVGIKTKGPGVNIEAGVNGPQVSVKTNLGGEKTAEGSVAGGGIQVTAGSVKLKAGTSVGNVAVSNDGKVTTDAAQVGATMSVTAKDIKQDQTAMEGKTNLADASLSVGIKAGIVGAEVTVNLIKAGNAIVDFFSTVIEYTKAYAKEKTESFGGNNPSKQ